MNLSIHPALINQPIVAPIANVQKGKISVWRWVQASKKLCVCDGVNFFLLPHSPALQCAIELIENRVKRQLVKLPVIVNPTSNHQVEHTGQIFKRLVGHMVYSATSDCSPHRLSRLSANNLEKSYKELSITVFG
jgi:hypothetical protein